ncbi:MAG: hypothetical protein ACE5LU_05875 [Anaerolineae bacterium]
MASIMSIPPHVRRLAQVLQRLTPEEMHQLVQLVPDLERAHIPEVLEEEREARAYFRRAAMELTGGELPSLQDEFVEGLTYEEYFALPEVEQDALWNRIFTEEEAGPYDLNEHDARSNARVAPR